MKMRLNLAQKGMAIVSILLLFELVFVGSLSFLLYRTGEELKRASEVREIISHLNNLANLFNQTTIGLVRVVQHQVLTRETEEESRKSSLYQRQYYGQAAEIMKELDKLKELLGRDSFSQAEDRRAVEDIKRLCLAGLDLMEKCRISSFEQNMVAHFRYSAQLQRLGEITLDRDHELLDHYSQLDAQIAEEEGGARRIIAGILLVGGVLNVLFAVFLVKWFSSNITRRLEIIQDNSLRLAADQPLKPVLAGSDEIAKVDVVFHKMADILKQEQELVKASEERVRSVIENLPVGVVTCDAKGNIDSINCMTGKMFAVEEQKVAGKPVSELFQTEKPVGEFVRDIKQLQPGKSMKEMGKRSSGEVFPVEITTAAYQVLDGERLLIHIEDITEFLEVERLKQDFVAMISHDLRTPLTSIGCTLTMLDEGVYGELDSTGLKRVTDAQRNIERLINMVSDLLDLEKLEAGRLTMELKPCDIKDVVEQSVAAVKSYAEQKEIKLNVGASQQTVSGDSDRLVQVVVNLISNAVKFSPAKGTISVSAARQGESVLISVADEGRGIPKEFQESIFERFQQVAASDAKRSMGSGLGLAICKAIVISHNGAIGVDSDGVKGSTFWIRLPLA